MASQPTLYLPAHGDESCGIPLWLMPNEELPLDHARVYIVRRGHRPGIFTHEGAARASHDGYKGADWQGKRYHAAKEDWHAYCLQEHTKDGRHPGPPPLRPISFARTAPTTLATARTPARTMRQATPTSTWSSSTTASMESTTVASVSSPAASGIAQTAKYVGSVYYHRAGQACASPHCPAPSSCSSCMEVDPLADMLNDMSVAEEDPLEPFRRKYFSAGAHVYHSDIAARTLKGRAQLFMHTTFYSALRSSFDLDQLVDHRFKVTVLDSRTREHAGELFYDTIPSLENAVNAICPFRWFVDITFCQE